jgi:hypothetical protein
MLQQKWKQQECNTIYVCMYICMCACIYTTMYVCMYVKYVYAYLYVCTTTYVYALHHILKSVASDVGEAGGNRNFIR